MKCRQQIQKTLIPIGLLICLSNCVPGFGQPAGSPLNKANTLIEHGNYSSALLILNGMINRHCKDARAYLLRSIIFGKAGNYKSALDDSSSAIYINPHLAKAYDSRAAAYIGLNQLSKACLDAENAVRMEPESALTHLMKSITLQRLGKYIEALKECDLSVKLEPQKPIVWLSRAQLLRQLGRYTDALRDFNKGLQRKGLNARLYIERGNTYLCIGNKQKAVSDYIAASKVQAQSSEDYAVRAEACFRLGKYQEQIENLNIALKLFPESELLLGQRSYANYNFWQFEQAINDCSLLDPSSDIQTNAILAYTELGQYNRALTSLCRILYANRSNCSYFASRAQLFKQLGKHDQERQDWNKVKKLSSKNEMVQIKLDNPLVTFASTQFCARDKYVSKMPHSKKCISFLTRNDGLIGVPIEINGKPLELELDTGSSYVNLWKHSLRKIGELKTIAWREKSAIGIDKPVKISNLEILKLANMTFTNFPVIIDGTYEGCKELQGLLGGNLLENFVVTVDFEHNQLFFENSLELDLSQKPIVVPMIIRGHSPFCKVFLNNNLGYMAQIDTGGYSIAPDVLMQPILQQTLKFDRAIYGSWLGHLQSSRAFVKTLQLGKAELEKQPFYIFRASDAPLAAGELTLGIDFLRQFKSVTFDYPGRRLIFRPFITNLHPFRASAVRPVAK